MNRALLFLLTAFSLLAQQTVNNFTVKTNLVVAGAKPTLYVTNVAAMRDLTALSSGQLVQTAGRTIPGYGGATYLWTAGLTTTTNLGTVFDLATGGTGRFTLAIGDPGDIRLWGALPASAVPGGTNIDVNIQAAIDTLTATTFGGSSKPRIFIPNGYWYVANTIDIENPVAFVGDGIELNSVNVSDYSLNGAVIGSNIGSGAPVIHVIGRNSGGSTYIQGVEIRNIGIDGNGSEGAGIWWDCDSNLSDCYTSRIIVRNVGGSAFKGGDGTLAGSPRYGYSTFEELTAIFPGLDGFEFYCENMATVKMRWAGLYVNGAGRHGHHFVNMGDFWAERWVENNAAQSQDGDGLHLQNVNNATFVDCYWEGDGRNQAGGGSYTPTYSAAAARLEGVSKCTFINCVLTSPSGDLSSPAASGVLELVSSTALPNGFSARDTGNNEFLNCSFTAYTPQTAAPSGSAAGSGGLLSAGVYRYRVAITYSGGWETPLSACGERVVTAVSSNSVSLTAIATGSTLGTNTVTGRKIYRTAANGSTFKLLTTLADNTTTVYTDTTADALLGADASFFWLIYADSASYLNRFTKANLVVQPLVSDAGVRNTFNTLYVANTSPSTMPNIGAGAFNNTFSSGFNGTRHFFGADSAGMLTGYGLTAATAKRASFVIPSYQSSRFAQSQATLLDGQITDTDNLVNLGGGNSSDFAATQTSIYAAAGTTTTTGTEQVRVTSAGTKFLTAIDLDTASTIDVTLAYSTAPVLDNNVWLKAKDSGGTARDLIGKSSGNVISIGSGTSGERINILPGTGGLFLGQPGVTASIYVPRVNTASATNTLRNSQIFGYVAAYWNGSAEVQYDATTRLSMDSTSPTASLYWSIGGTDRMQLKSDGTLRVVTGPIQLVTVTISTGSGSPEGVVTAATGSIYMNTSGGAGTTFYVKESGSGNTGWVGK